MKKLLPSTVVLLMTLCVEAQITTPVIKANFGVDGELRTNIFKGNIQSSDDWFSDGTAGVGQQVIDTTGAAAIYSRYLVDPAFRKQPFFRVMRVPQLTVVNNRLWVDAVYIRDYNGQSGGDSTAFTLSNKNGQSPGNWSGGVTSVLDKNDISDMMVHVKRAGPNKTDSLWFFGGLSLQGTTGNRYFDFELYQTDIFYSRSTGQFTNYGPNSGHTAWELDAAGNITKPGDVIFTAEYSSSSLTAVEARVWVNKADLNKTPAAFTWGGSFDGATTSATYGYANIKPKTSGDYYTGLQSGNNTWAGPFGFINDGNSVMTTYSARQFMEFSVNLSKLGLDPITLLGSTACGMPFRRILVKTRTSTSFSSELKDFIGPFDFFKAPAVEATTDVPWYCGPMGVSNITVTNALQASVYTWSTPDGHFTDPPSGTTVRVDSPGTYIVTQQLLDGCSNYASDTIVIVHNSGCTTLDRSLLSFTGTLQKSEARLRWRTAVDAQANDITLQRSLDGTTFQNIYTQHAAVATERQQYNDALQAVQTPVVYYRLAIRSSAGALKYSNVVRLQPDMSKGSVLYPNPAATTARLTFYREKNGTALISVRNASGATVYAATQSFSKGHTAVTFDALRRWTPGLYMVGITDAGRTEWLKLVVTPKEADGMR